MASCRVRLTWLNCNVEQTFSCKGTDEFIEVAFLLTNLNPDFATRNLIFRFIKDQTNQRLQSK